MPVGYDAAVWDCALGSVKQTQMGLGPRERKLIEGICRASRYSEPIEDKSSLPKDGYEEFVPSVELASGEVEVSSTLSDALSRTCSVMALAGGPPNRHVAP